MIAPFNRTIVELKQGLKLALYVVRYPFNRTIVELKPLTRIATKKAEGLLIVP